MIFIKNRDKKLQQATGSLSLVLHTNHFYYLQNIKNNTINKKVGNSLLPYFKECHKPKLLRDWINL